IIKFMGIAEGSIKLIDATGKLVHNSQLTAEGISLAHLPRGLYYYQLLYRGQVLTGKVMRE
ncbi:T9SS type A sorting domain-containing protein, partial [Umezakia ovalisporum]|uniref:T9SS type A sorting domain-containing protein n=1 Tax=Umezakia ovalisporum TaxID=75695 RepID=UPI0039C6F88E